MFIKILDWWKRRGTVRKEIRLVSYQEAELLLKQGWTLAPEEDDNHIGAMTRMVYLELLVNKNVAL